MQTKRRAFGRQHRLWALALAVALTCIPMMGTASAAPAIAAYTTAEEAAPKPTVSIVGNVVIDKNKPTGFYELSLRVKTPRIITLKDDPSITVDEDVYIEALENDAKNGTNIAATTYNVKNYPFQSATAAVHINLNALTAVTWGSGKPIYSKWSATDGFRGDYETCNSGYPLGIDLSVKDQPDIFTDLSKIISGEAASVRLDTANPDEMVYAAGLIEDYDAATGMALLTLTASTSTTKNVVYDTETPVVVVRFAYDLNRFENWSVEKGTDFWVGLDKNATVAEGGPGSSRLPVTYLGEGKVASGGSRYADSDKQAADSTAQQAVWYTQNIIDDNVGQRATHFYYYLGAETQANEGKQSYQIVDGAPKTETLIVPETVGFAVIAKRSMDWPTATDPEAAADGNPDYSFFQNLLTIGEDKLKIYVENAETYRKPTGSGGTTILFYDWDDSLIGSLVVDKGDVRAEVEEYIEENLVHPDLRPGTALAAMGGKLPDENDFTSSTAAQDYQTLVNSLSREYSYRGKYAYTVGGNDAVGENGDTENQGRADGEEYPLTNKLDYVFTKRVNTALSRTLASGATTTYVLPHKVTDVDMADAALYPYTYGWAVVEDTTKTNDWKVMYDAAKTEDVWTTIGVGELYSVDPDYYDNAAAAVKNLPAAAVANGAYTAPQFLVDADPGWTDLTQAEGTSTTYTNKYAYQLSSTGAESYFRFADFSNIDAELARYQKASGANKDTLVVKAVYEPGKSLMDGNDYRLIKKPVYSKFNSQTASQGAAFRVRLTLERSYIEAGAVRGTTRVRFPQLQLDTTTDYKWLVSSDPAVDHNLPNATLEVANNRTDTTYIKVDVDNGEEVTFDLSLSARMNKIDYVLVESNSANFVVGTQRSESNGIMVEDYFIPDNYNYLAEDTNEEDDYYDCDYATRDGSYGFVLYGTIGHLLEQTTKLRNGEINDLSFESSVTYLTAQDANLRVESSKQIGATVAERTALRQGLKEVELLCYQNRGTQDAPGDYDCWNWELDCAQLTYHQLQHYLVGHGFMTKKDADDAKLDWCHLHASCAAALSTVPDTWEKVIAAARANNEADLKKMTVTAIETLTALRRNASGRQFDTSADFTTAIIDAVSKLDAAGVEPTWGSVQYVILNKTVEDEAAMKEAGQAAYWWYDGSTSAPTLPSVTSNKEAQWNFLLQAAKDSYQPVPTLKDGVTSDWTSTVRLNLAQTPFNRNDTPDQTINRNWVNLTHNLVLDAKEEIRSITLDDGSTELEYIYTHTKFPDFDTFKTKLVEAVQAAETADAWPPTWEQLQWYIIKGTWDPDPDASVFGQEGFWWKDGNVPLRVSSLTTLLQILDMRDNPATPDDRDNANKALGKVNAGFFDDSLYFRFDADGKNGQLKLADLPGGAKDAAWAIEQVNAARKAGATTWNQVQYYLLNGKLEENVNAMNQQGAYYWWRNGGEGNEIDFSAAGNLQMKLNTLMMATTYTAFSDPKAIESVNNAVGSDVFSFLRLIASTGGKELLEVKDLETDVKPNAHADANALLADVAAFKAEAQRQQGKGEYDLPTAYWYQLQYYILNNEYIPVGYKDPMDVKPSYDSLIDPETGYWWYDPTLTARPEPEPPPVIDETPYTKFVLDIINDNVYSGKAIPTISNTDADGTGLLLQGPNGKITGANLKKILGYLVTATNLKDYAVGGRIELTWAQLEYYCESARQIGGSKLNKAGVLKSHADSIAGLISEFGWTTADFPAGVITE